MTMDAVPLSGELSPWAEVLGPKYTAEAIARNGLGDRTDLIGLTTSSGVIIYPQGQFDVLVGGSLQPRESVLKIWSLLVVPAVEEGLIDEFTLAGIFFETREDGRSRADTIASDDRSPTARGAIIRELIDMINSLRNH